MTCTSNTQSPTHQKKAARFYRVIINCRNNHEKKCFIFVAPKFRLTANMSVAKKLFGSDTKGSVSVSKVPVAFRTINVRRLAIRLWAWKLFKYIRSKRNDIHKQDCVIGSMPIFGRYSESLCDQLFEKSEYTSGMFSRVFSNEDLDKVEWETVIQRLRNYEDEEGLPNIQPFITTFSPSELTVQVFSTVSSTPFDVRVTSLSDPKVQAAETIVQYDLPHEELDHVISTIQHGLLIA